MSVASYQEQSPTTAEEEYPVFAYDYPLLGVFWTMLEIFAFFIWIWLLIIVFTDIFRSSDLGGLAKTLWVVFVLIVPLFGVLIYLIARGGSMHERAAAQAQRQDEAFRAYVQETAGPPSVTEELTNLANLRDSGVITEAEFQAAKEKALA
jgi:ABC-type multidrug transport system fused ATPase/permease subunit